MYGRAVASRGGDYKFQPWKHYPGNSRILCGGRIITARNSGAFFIALVLILVGFAAFSTFEWTYLAVAVSPLVAVIDIILFVMVISLKMRCALMDPGFIKRDSKMNYENLKNSAIFYYGKRSVFHDSEKGVRYLTVPIKGYNYKTKYCTTCNIYRPPRSKHCADCDACVCSFYSFCPLLMAYIVRLDHHCPWLMNCIGQRNYKYFFCYVSILTFLIFYQFVFSVFHIILLHRSVPDYTLLFKENIPIFLSVGYHMILGVLVVSLVYYHCGLATSNITTNEDIKNTLVDYDSNPFLTSKPHDFGSKIKELQSLLCTPVPPSVLDLRGVYTQEDIKSTLEQFYLNEFIVHIVGLPYHSSEIDPLLKLELNDPISANILRHYKYTNL